MSKQIQKNLLKKLAPLYVVLTLLFYLTFFIYWRHTKAVGNQINWIMWMMGVVAAFLIPLVFVINQRLETSNSPQTINCLAMYRRLLGVLLVILPFVAMTFIDTSDAVSDYYVTHQYSPTPGISSIVSERALLIILNGVPMLLGLFLIFLGRSKLNNVTSLIKLMLALVLTIGLFYALYLYAFGKYYEF